MCMFRRDMDEARWSVAWVETSSFAPLGMEKSKSACDVAVTLAYILSSFHDVDL